jgi:hypothetical protein
MRCVDVAALFAEAILRASSVACDTVAVRVRQLIETQTREWRLDLNSVTDWVVMSPKESMCQGTVVYGLIEIRFADRNCIRNPYRQTRNGPPQLKSASRLEIQVGATGDLPFLTSRRT